jgi:hypothetical protein
MGLQPHPLVPGTGLFRFHRMHAAAQHLQRPEASTIVLLSNSLPGILDVLFFAI